MWIGIDDTDSWNGGCTTYLASRVISSLQKIDVHLIGFPRLVRLNPNVPWKTRGNGAVSFQIGSSKDELKEIGWMSNNRILSSPSMHISELPDKKIQLVKEILIENIHSLSDLSEGNTNPGVVLVSDQFDESLYWNGVQKIVNRHETIRHIKHQSAWFKEFNNGRGIIGAAASIAWRGIHDSSFELIAYRKKNRWGSDRFVDDESVRLMDQKCSSTFDNYDYDTNHMNIKPNSPCPVLFGIRGDDSNVLFNCMKQIICESFEDWLIFSSNQGTDDHLVTCDIKEVQPFRSVIVSGIVGSKPETITGGHVIFRLRNKHGHHIDCISYEPTKKFRTIIWKLEPGDVVNVFGGVREKPFSINLEKIEIVSLAKVIEKIENPLCPVCNKHMKSKGKNQGFRCKKCKTFSSSALLKEKKRSIIEGLYEVPVSARRHVSKPLKRMKT